MSPYASAPHYAFAKLVTKAHFYDKSATELARVISHCPYIYSSIWMLFCPIEKSGTLLLHSNPFTMWYMMFMTPPCVTTQTSASAILNRKILECTSNTFLSFPEDSPHLDTSHPFRENCRKAPDNSRVPHCSTFLPNRRYSSQAIPRRTESEYPNPSRSPPLFPPPAANHC